MYNHSVEHMFQSYNFTSKSQDWPSLNVRARPDPIVFEGGRPIRTVVSTIWLLSNSEVILFCIMRRCRSASCRRTFAKRSARVHSGMRRPPRCFLSTSCRAMSIDGIPSLDRTPRSISVSVEKKIERLYPSLKPLPELHLVISRPIGGGAYVTKP